MNDVIIQSIRKTASDVLPSNGYLYLFGSQVRGDANKDSDWDLLIVLDKPKIEETDHDKYSYPFWQLGWSLDAMIHPVIYTKAEWELNKSTFHYNVENDAIRIC